MLITPNYNGLLIPPTGFVHNIPCKVYWNGQTFITDLNRFNYKISTATDFYVASWGNNANSGLSWNNAVADGDTANALGFATGLPYTIYIDGSNNAIYDRNKGFSVSPKLPCNMIGINGKPIISAEQALTYSAYSGSAYVAARSSILWLFDEATPTSYGDALRWSKVADAATVVSTPASFFTDNVNVYARASDSRNLATSSAGLLNFLKINPPTLSTNNNIYVENINFRGFQTAAFTVTNASASDDITAYFYNCDFKYANDSSGTESNGNGLSILGATKVILDSCLTTSNYLDGNNYHYKNNVIPHVIEVNSTSRSNGYSTIAPEANNATTIHDGSRAIRVNGAYPDSQGRNVHDVSASTGNLTQSWNIGCNAYNSRSLTSTGSANWVAGDGTSGHTQMWLTNCLSSGSIKDYIINSGDTLNYNLGSQAGSWSGTNNGGTLATFTQQY